MRYAYCPRCGTKLVLRAIGDEGEVPFCPACSRPWFDTFSTCTITLVISEHQEALLLRQDYINRQAMVLISGYIKPGESAEETARREVREETGIRVESLEIVGTFWLPPKDMLMVGFFARARKADLTLSGEVDAARWVPVREALDLVPRRADSTARKLVELWLERHPEPDAGRPERSL